MQFNDLVGQKFNRLKVIEYKGHKQWLCQCDCGNFTIVRTHNLKKGTTKSCGCYAEELKTLANYKDDKRAKTLYQKWLAMKTRCYNPNTQHYKSYGGKGIKVCDEWKDSFENFYKWSIENGYKEIEGSYIDRLAIDRIDSSKNYTPDNCRWISVADNVARISKTNQHLEELNKMSSDELVQDYIQRKMEMNLEIQAEKKEIRQRGFFVRKNNYCIIRNNDRTKQFLFKSFKIVGLFLELSYSQLRYRVKYKNGILNDDWKIEKLTKEEFDELSRNVEVIV